LNRDSLVSQSDPKFVEIYGEVDDAETVYWCLKAQDVFAWEYQLATSASWMAETKMEFQQDWSRPS